MKNFDFYFDLYLKGDEALYIELSSYIVEELIKECGKDLAKYYDFQCFLYDMVEYYK